MYKDREYQEQIRKPKQMGVTLYFDSFENLLLASKRLDSIKYEGVSSLYYDEHRGRYFINLEDVSLKELKFAFLTEYCGSFKSNGSQFVKEHFKCICKKDAVKKLSACCL